MKTLSGSGRTRVCRSWSRRRKGDDGVREAAGGEPPDLRLFAQQDRNLRLAADLDAGFDLEGDAELGVDRGHIGDRADDDAHDRRPVVVLHDEDVPGERRFAHGADFTAEHPVAGALDEAILHDRSRLAIGLAAEEQGVMPFLGSGSVMRRTVAVRSLAEMTRPTRAFSARTMLPTWTPLEMPRSMVQVSAPTPAPRPVTWAMSR